MKTLLSCPKCGHEIAVIDTALNANAPAAAYTPPQAATVPPSDPQTASGETWPVGACPKHGPDRWVVSKFGGMYCTAKDESQQKGYCVLKSDVVFNGKRIPA